MFVGIATSVVEKLSIMDTSEHGSQAWTPPWPATEIVEGVWQSGHPWPGERWDAVIDLDGNQPPLEDVGLYVCWPIVDGPVPDHGLLVALADLIADLRRAGKRVLIHCAGGMNRSGLLVAAALIRNGMGAAEAIKLIRDRRPGALNNQQFVEHLLERL
ncbi:MAG: protein-tyrosine phosphatase family protein [Egibacteraceae bacterium]